MLVRVRARPVVDVSSQQIHLDFVVCIEASRLPREYAYGDMVREVRATGG